MKKNGFTLVEVIVTIVILSILSVIMVPMVQGMLTKSNNNTYKQLLENIKASARMYVTDNKYTINFNCGVATPIYLKTLVDKEYLTGKLIDKRDDSNINADTSYINVTYDCTNRVFTYSEPTILK